jgi:hypothetical protein
MAYIGLRFKSWKQFYLLSILSVLQGTYNEIPMDLRPFGTFLKLVVAPVGLIWLVTSLFTDKLFSATNPIWPLLSIALILNQLALTMFAFRMRMALRAFGIDVSLYQAQRIHLQSMFYFFVLPMTVGLEAARFGKIKYLLNAQTSGIGLASSLLVDRLIGALAAVLLAIAVWPMLDFQIPLNWHQDGFLPWVTMGLVAVIAVPVGRKVLRSLPSFSTVAKPSIDRLSTPVCNGSLRCRAWCKYKGRFCANSFCNLRKYDFRDSPSVFCRCRASRGRWVGGVGCHGRATREGASIRYDCLHRQAYCRTGRGCLGIYRWCA